MLIDIIKNNLFIQNLIASMMSYIPPIVEHNYAKYQAIKKALYQTALEHTKGNYLEFGVFTGSSFNFAMKINSFRVIWLKVITRKVILKVIPVCRPKLLIVSHVDAGNVSSIN